MTLFASSAWVSFQAMFMLHLSCLNILNLIQVRKLFCCRYKPFQRSQPEPAVLGAEVGSAQGQGGSCPVTPAWADPGFLPVLGQQSCGNSVWVFHQIHPGFSFTAPKSCPSTAGLTHQKYLLTPAPASQYPHQNSLQ